MALSDLSHDTLVQLVKVLLDDASVNVPAPATQPSKEARCVEVVFGYKVTQEGAAREGTRYTYLDNGVGARVGDMVWVPVTYPQGGQQVKKARVVGFFYDKYGDDGFYSRKSIMGLA